MKTKIKKIMVPVDFTETSETAIAQAIKISKLADAEVFLIHVVEYKEYQFSVLPETQTILPPIRDIEMAVKRKMDLMQEDIRKKSGVLPKIFVTTGRIDTEIVDFAERKKINLIIMGTHGASGYKEIFIGSNAQRVVTLSEIPVLTMQNKTSTTFKKILLPIDNSLHSREKVNIAIEIAHLSNAEIFILGLPDSKDKTELDKFKIKLKSVQQIIDSSKLVSKTIIVGGDNLAEVAMNYSRENECDLIVINTGHESQTTGVFLGAFAQQIVNHSIIPVLSVKHTESDFIITTPGFGIS